MKKKMPLLYCRMCNRCSIGVTSVIQLVYLALAATLDSFLNFLNFVYFDLCAGEDAELYHLSNKAISKQKRCKGYASMPVIRSCLPAPLIVYDSSLCNNFNPQFKSPKTTSLHSLCLWFPPHVRASLGLIFILYISYWTTLYTKGCIVHEL